jgi:excisionase family DNA binding protein
MTKPPKPLPDHLLTPDEVMATLGLSRTWVYAHLQRGTIRSTRLGRFYRVSPAEVARIRKEGLPPLAGSGTGKRKAPKRASRRPRASPDPLA